MNKPHPIPSPSHPDARTSQAEEQYRRVVEDRTALNSKSYATRAAGDRWTKEDTDLFFTAIAQFGTDFTLIARLFPSALLLLLLVDVVVGSPDGFG